MSSYLKIQFRPTREIFGSFARSTSKFSLPLRKGPAKGGAIVSNRYAVSYITTGIFRIYLATGWAWTTYKFISSDQQKERLFDFLVFLLEAAD